MAETTMLARTIGELNRVVGNIAPEQLGESTLCTEWTVRDVLGHVVQGGTMFAIAAEKGEVPEAELDALFAQNDPLGGDYKAVVRTSSERARDAFAVPGVLERTLTIPGFGTLPGEVLANIAVFDVTTHICDLAQATGQRIADEALLATALGIGRAIDSPDLRSPGRLDAAQPAPSSATGEEQLLAFAGRKV
jgi:uncharacterized protein (TIGR03086 family)